MSFSEITIFDGVLEVMFNFDVDTGKLLRCYTYVDDVEDMRKEAAWFSTRRQAAEDGMELFWDLSRRGVWKTGENPLFMHCTKRGLTEQLWNELCEYANEEDLAGINWPQSVVPRFNKPKKEDCKNARS